MKKFALAACMALLLIGGGIAYSTPTSYLSVDINPSVELGVNALDIVVEAEALNEDGEAVLEGLDVDNVQVDEAVSLIVDAAADQGYIEEDGSSAILLTASTDDEEQAAELTADAEAGALDALEENEVAAEVSMASITEARRAAALAAGISPGKMNLIEKLREAQNNGETATTGEDSVMGSAAGVDATNWADAPVKDIMKAIKATRTGADLEATDSDLAAGDVAKHGKGKANAPGQQLKAGSGDGEDDDLVLLDGKVEPNASDDIEEEEVDELEAVE